MIVNTKVEVFSNNLVPADYSDSSISVNLYDGVLFTKK